MFNTIDINGLGRGRSTDNKISLLVARIVENMDVISDKNYIYIKDGLYYKQIEKQTFLREFITLFNRVVNLPDYEGSLWRPKYGENAWKHLQALCYRENIDTYPNLIPFKNGVFNIKSNIFSPSFTELLVYHFPFNYNPTPNPIEFKRVIKEIIPNNEDREFFLTFMNYAFTGDINNQLALILLGSGNNGKTKLMEFFIKLMGPRATTTKINKLTDDSVRCNLKGKTLCYSSEIGGHYMNQDLMETIKETITEVNKSGRKPYMQLEEWINTTKFICATNNLPQLQMFEKAFLRRFKIIEFPIDFTGREDRTLFDRLYELEGGDILSWILQEFNDWSILTVDWKETESLWRYKSDAVKRFIEEECDIDYGYRISTNIIYDAYVKYCIKDDEAPLSQRYFTRRMTKLGYNPIRDIDGAWKFEGIVLKKDLLVTVEV